VNRCGVPVSTPHSSGLARLASGAFYETIKGSVKMSVRGMEERLTSNKKELKREGMASFPWLFLANLYEFITELKSESEL
jgi:hypothetical protein